MTHKTSLALAIGLVLAVRTAPAAAQTNPANSPSAAAATSTETTPAQVSPTQGGTSSNVLGSVEVSAKLDKSRNQISTSIGASQYVMDSAAIERLPLGDATPLNQILLQAPGVVQDSFGEMHVRGDHGDMQYRINGVTLPESISGFGQMIDPDIIERVQLLTGALPAQYGYRTAGVVEIITESGAHRHHDDEDDAGENENYGGRVGAIIGSHGTFNPELSFHGSTDKWSWFLTGDYEKNDNGIENPTRSYRAIHDHSQQLKGFGYLSYLINENARASFMFGVANNRFEIPNNPGQAPNYQLAGVTSADSAKLDQRQRETNRFGIVALQGGFGDTDYQLSLGQRYTSVDYHPDPIGDLVFNGVAGTIHRANRDNTLQLDMSTPLAGGRHTLRYGVYASSERPVSNNTSLVFPADADGNQTSTTPITIVDNAPRITAKTQGVYVQDEWHLGDRLTLNYGVRADKVNAYVKESQTSPRIGIVYTASTGTTLHAGYARYFTPPADELISPADIALFQGTTNQLPTNANTSVRSERSHYYDIGVTQKLGQAWTFGLDAYSRRVRNMMDEGQFGSALVYSPFNYNHGRARGYEFTANYAKRDLNGYLNVSQSSAMGKEIVTGQYNFGQDELDYIASHWVHLDHDQRLTGSGGVSYDWHGTKFGMDFLYGSGLRHQFANSAHMPEYWQLNLSVARMFNLPEIGKVSARLAVINAADARYQLRDGSGIGVGAPQWGPRAGAYLALGKAF